MSTKINILDQNDRADIDSAIENLSNVSEDTILNKINSVPLSKGGTGSTTAEGARTALGAAASEHGHSAADIISGVLDISRGGTGATTAAQALVNLGLGNAARIEVGSYVGTGTYGRGESNYITFSFNPKFVLIMASDTTGDHGVWVSGSDRFAINGQCLVNTKGGFEYYSPISADEQMNKEQTYYYVAIG